LARDAIELAEKVQLGFLAMIAIFGVEQVFCQVIHDAGTAFVFQVGEVEVDPFTDDALIGCAGRAKQFWGQFQHMIGAEIRLQRIRPVRARFQAFSVSQFHGMSSSMRFIL
jgi:hypothetical protein